MRVVGILLLLTATSLAQAQVRPQPGAGNPHLQSVEYRADEVVTLESAPGYQLTLELAPDERVENVAVGDSGAWQVTANRRGDRLFIKPVQPGVTTNMVVVTDARTYTFELSPLFSATPNMAYTVRFRYPSPQAGMSPPSGEAPQAGRYRLSGSPALKPVRVTDDGTHTFIEWPADRPLPAIYVLSAHGQEMLVNAMMREGRIVIDGVEPRLMFRIDNRSATATRLDVKKR